MIPVLDLSRGFVTGNAQRALPALHGCRSLLGNCLSHKNKYFPPITGAGNGLKWDSKSHVDSSGSRGWMS